MCCLHTQDTFFLFKFFLSFQSFFFLFSTTCSFLRHQNAKFTSKSPKKKIRTSLSLSFTATTENSSSSRPASPCPLLLLLPAAPSLPTMCDDSCSRGGTRRCYRHSSSADRWEARSRLRPTAFTSARGGNRISRRHVSRSRMSVISGDSSAGDGNRGVHQALCGGIVVSDRPSSRGLVASCGAWVRSYLL